MVLFFDEPTCAHNKQMNRVHWTGVPCSLRKWRSEVELNMKKKRLIRVCLIIAATAFMGATARGGEVKLAIDDKDPAACLEDPAFCKIFDRNVLYKNDEASVIQQVRFLARYHGQQHSTTLEFDNPAAGPNRYGDSYWEHRRFRVGGDVRFLKDFTFYSEVDFHDNDLLADAAFFNNIALMGILWKPSEDFYVNVGKQKPKITREWTPSSNLMLTPERAMITNEVIPYLSWGGTVGFEAWGLQHEFGGWLNAGYESNTVNQPFGPHWPMDRTRGSLSYRANCGLNENTKLFFDYLYTNNSEGRADGAGRAGALGHADFASSYNQVISLGSESTWRLGPCDKKFSLLTDFIVGLDREAFAGRNNAFPGNNFNAGEDLFGIVILPAYDLTERLELVTRYAFASEAVIQRPERAPFSDDPDGLAPGLARPALEDIHTFYLGFNYRLCGDHLKLLGGYEYLTGDVTSSGTRDNGGVTGNSWIFGVRTFW